MKSAVNTFLVLLWVTAATLPCPGQAQTASEPTPEMTYHLVQFLPSYRFVSTSGFPGRVAEYDSLDQSVGGDLALTFLDHSRQSSMKYRAEFISRDDYDQKFELRWGKHFTLGIQSRSFIRHLEDIPFGTNLDPDETNRTDVIPQDALFGVKRTRNAINARIKVPNTPVTVFVKGGFQSRRGWSQMQWFSMGNTAAPGDPFTCEGSCHSAAQFRKVNYTTRDVGGGIELKLGHVSLTYEHDFSSFNDRMQNPSDLYGSAISIIPDEPLPPGVPNTLQGNYIHNLLPSHRTFSDKLRLRAPLGHMLVFNGSTTYGHTKNTFTGNPLKFFHADATLNWNPTKRLRAMADFHQQNTLNDFIPLATYYGQFPPLTITDPSTGITTSFTPGSALFGNPSIHRFWTEVRLDYALSSNFDAEAHYRRTNITRSNCDLWPQVYSPNNAALLATSPCSISSGIPDAYAARLIPTTFSNTAGVSVRFHRGEAWALRSGYEWVGTHAPGYLTDPQTTHRIFVSGVVSPKSWLSFSDDFSVLRENSFPGIQRDNRLYLNTAYVILKPIADWSVGAGYSYYQNNLRSDLMYTTDPALYLGTLVPFKAISQGVTVNSTYLMKKKLAWTVEAGHVSSSSSFRPDLTDPSIPVCVPGPPVDILCSVSVPFGAAFSRVAVPQISANSVLDYRWKGGFDSGFRFQYGSYANYQYGVNPDLTLNPVPVKTTGILRTYSLFFGKTW